MNPGPEYFPGVNIFHWSSVRFGVELCVHLAHFFYVNTLQGKGGYGDTGCGGHRKR